MFKVNVPGKFEYYSELSSDDCKKQLFLSSSFICVTSTYVLLLLLIISKVVWGCVIGQFGCDDCYQKTMRPVWEKMSFIHFLLSDTWAIPISCYNMWFKKYNFYFCNTFVPVKHMRSLLKLKFTFLNVI